MAERPDLNKQLAHLEQEERRELINYHNLNKGKHE